MNEQTKHQPPAIVTFKNNMNKMMDQGEFALPDNVSPDAFRNAAIIAVQDTPEILNADQHSLFKSLRRAAASGLVPDGREGALVTFKTKDRASGNWINKVQFMPMVFGLIKMVRRSGTVRDIRAHIVYQKELDEGKFSYVVGDEEHLEHHPILFGDRGDPVAAYAIANLTDGTIVREFMTAEEIDRVRRAGSSQRVFKKGEAPTVSDTPIGIWSDWWSEMWKKTLIRRLTKRLDMSAEDVRRVMDEAEFDGLRDVTPKEPGGFAKKALAARGKDVSGDEGADEAEAPQDAEDAPSEDDSAPHWTEEIDTSDGFPGDDAFTEGNRAYKMGDARTVCPYEDDHEAAASWLAGWGEAKRVEEEMG